MAQLVEPTTPPVRKPRENAAHADISFWLCSGLSANGGFGSAEHAKGSCPNFTRFRAGPERLGPGYVNVLIAITPHRPGSVHIEGVDIRYRQGIRWGRQHTGFDMRTHTTSQ